MDQIKFGNLIVFAFDEDADFICYLVKEIVKCLLKTKIFSKIQ